MPTEETRAREFGAFDRIPDHYPRFVVSMDLVDMSRNGICHLNICDFLEQNVLGHCGPAGFYDFPKFVFVLNTGFSTDVFDKIPTNDFQSLTSQIDARSG